MGNPRWDGAVDFLLNAKSHFLRRRFLFLLSQGSFSFRFLDFLVRDCFPLAFASAGIRTCSLAAHRKSAAMSESAIAVDPDETLDVILNLTSQIAFNDIFSCKNSVQPRDLVFVEQAGAHVLIK